MGAMRIPGLRKTIHNESGYMPVGSKPSADVWTPRVHVVDGEPERVPRRFRGLRLRRRRSREEPTPLHMLIPILVAAFGFLFLLAYRILFG